MSSNILDRAQRLCGWLSLILLAVLVISGCGWDMRTSDLVSRLSAGLLNRTVSADLHSALIIPTVALLAFHTAFSLWKASKNRNR